MQNLPRLTFLSILAATTLALAPYFGDRWLVAADPALAAPEAVTDTPAAEAAAAAADPAVELLRESRKRLFSYTSVRASLREFVALGDRRFEAEGTYIAGPFNPLPQLRLEYQVRVGNTVGTLLEVCDGQILHTQRTLERVDAAVTGGEPPQSEITVTRRDVRKILDEVHKNGATPATILQAELGLGGLPALLTSIERVMDFQGVKEEPLGGRKCYLLQGTWKPKFLTDLQTQFAHFGRNVQSFVPETVRIHLDGETLFPVRIAYWPPPASEGPARPALLTLEFTDIHLNEQVSPLLFEYVSAGADETDITKQFIEAIRTAANPPPEVPADAP